MDAVDRLSGRGVDAHDVGPGMVGQPQRRVQQTLGKEVVDVGTIAEGEFEGLHLDAAGSHASAGQGHRHLTGGQGLHGVENLHVAGAAIQVGAQVPGRVVAFQYLPLAGRLVQ